MTVPGAQPPRAVVLTAEGFEDLELFVPMFRLIEAGWVVDVAAPTKSPIHGEHGYGMKPSLAFDEVDGAGDDLLFIPGGFPDGAPDAVRKHATAVAITRAFVAASKPIASICHAPWVLVAAGAVQGRRLTSYWHDGVPEDIRAAGGEWIDASVVVDGNLVTSRWPMDLPDFARELMKVAATIRR